jgi:predicted Rossmann fold flavoprotein
METNIDVLVVGAGASGLCAAVEASRAGASVLVLEKNHVPGRKILSTGSGKCNFSNSRVTPGNYHPPAAAFLKKTFAALPPADVTSFFEGLGLLWVKDEKGRLFPRSLKAQDVAGVLSNELAFRGGRVQTLTEVSAIVPAADGFAVEACKVPPQWEKKAARGEKLTFRARRVILCAGGPCYPQIGGSAGGYDLLRSLGHTVSPPAPAIVPLRSEETFLAELDGVRAEASLRLMIDGTNIGESRGELLFTAYGVSGPAVLDLSRSAVTAMKEYEVSIEADFFQDMKEEKLAALLKRRAALFAGRPFRHFACGLLNEKIMKAAAARCGAGWDAPVSGELSELAAMLKSFPISISGAQGFGDAMVSAGGCALSEIDPAVFSSLKAPGLYIAGELLDLDGDSGGYNLHLAWTSGILAGRAAAKR